MCRAQAPLRAGIGSWRDATRLRVVNNTVFANQFGIIIGSGDHHHGWSAPNDRAVVANNIVYDNEVNGIDEQGATGACNVYVSNLSYQNGRADWSLQNGLKPIGSIAADPRFVDCALAAGSPAIDKGSPSFSPGADIAGVSRPRGAGADMGAFESSSVR